MKILLTGGSACGKSTYAEVLAARLGKPRYYIATMRPYDDECLDKIARHQEQRADKDFTTIEQHTDLASLRLPERGTVLVECMCNWLANEMFSDSGEMRDPYDDIMAGISSLEAQCEHLLLVSNEVGGDCLSFEEGTRAYVRLLGRLNADLAARFDTVLELVCGIPLVLKGELI